MLAEVRDGFAVSPADVVRLAASVLDAACDLGEATGRFHGDASVGAAAFGNLPAGPSLAGACLDAQSSAGIAAERLVQTLEGDVDRLYQVAFAYQEAEQAATRSLRIPMGPR